MKIEKFKRSEQLNLVDQFHQSPKLTKGKPITDCSSNVSMFQFASQL